MPQSPSALPWPSVRGIASINGQLERAAKNTICRYYGDAKVTVEIDPGSEIDAARVSVEAYGDTCASIDDIGEEALFCTGGLPAEGLTGQIVWTDDEHTLFVVYNFGDTAPSKDIPLELSAPPSDLNRDHSALPRPARRGPGVTRPPPTPPNPLARHRNGSLDLRRSLPDVVADQHLLDAVDQVGRAR